MDSDIAGFQEIEHTADWALRVWAPNLSGLFVQAAVGMNSLAEVLLQPEGRLERRFTLNAGDAETLLVSFLEELLYYAEQDDIGFDNYELEIQELELKAHLAGALIRSRRKEIKAVTFHNLEIVRDENGYRVQIVFDV